MRSALRGTTREESGSADRFGFDRLAPMTGTSPTARLEPIVHAAATHSRRWVFPTPYSFAAIPDTFEKMKQLHMPESEYAIAGAADYNRNIDLRIVTAALGAAMEGEQTLASVAFDTTNRNIVHGSDGLTVDKVVDVRSRLGEVTNEELEMYGPFYFLYHPRDVRLLFASVQATSSDFVNVQALMSGKVVQGYLGFDWRPCNQLPIIDAGPPIIRGSVAYARAGMGFGANLAARKEDMGPRRDITGIPTQISIFDQFGAVRVDDRLVYRVEIDTSVVPS
jgi:hypothetical protein